MLCQQASSPGKVYLYTLVPLFRIQRALHWHTLLQAATATEARTKRISLTGLSSNQAQAIRISRLQDHERFMARRTLKHEVAGSLADAHPVACMPEAIVCR